MWKIIQMKEWDIKCAGRAVYEPGTEAREREGLNESDVIASVEKGWRG